MRFSTSKAAAMTRVAALGLALATSAAQAELIIGLNTDNQILSFDSATPGTLILGPTTVTGLLPSDILVGIDRRPTLGPNNGVLYGFTQNSSTPTLGRLYTINLSAPVPVATLASTLSAPLSGPFGTLFGIDFNPVPDRLRVVSTVDQNLRINVDNGATTVDTPLAYKAGDPNAGTNPEVVAVAYSNNFGGAMTTLLRDIDSNLDILASQDPPNSGTLNTLGALGINISALAGYDISGLSAIGYAVFADATDSSNFYTINPATGAATLVGAIGGDQLLLDIAAPVGIQQFPVPAPGTLSLLALGVLGLFAARRRRA